jgi:hypothetical protein
MSELIGLGYMEPVPPEDLQKPASASYYFPHHAVLKPESSSTKVRIVNNASQVTSSGVSLNDVLLTGPKLQIDLAPLLIRWMTHRVALSADIWKFYLQTHVHPKDRDYHRFLWRESPDLLLQHWRMTRNTFGVSPAPFLATRALHQLADDEQEDFPHLNRILKEEFLVDNLLSGAPEVNSAISLQKDLVRLM